MYEVRLALQALADLHRVPLTGRLATRYLARLSGHPQAAVVSAIMRAGRECRRFPPPEAILNRLPRGCTPPASRDLPDDPPAPTAAQRATVRRLAADYLARHDEGRK